MQVAYDGTAYGGWQVQPNAPTIQACIEKALKELTGETIRIHGSGRTDAGVHAKGQVFHFDLVDSKTPEVLLKALNALLPDDIRLLGVKEVDPEFHSRFSALKKEYRYFIYNGPTLAPFERNYRTHVRVALDVDRMRDAAQRLVGENDFAAFSSLRLGDPDEDTVRNLMQLDLDACEGELVLTAVGNGFLYKMVRGLAGFMIEVGRGRMGPDDVAGLLASGKRSEVVPTADAKGLFLWEVSY